MIKSAIFTIMAATTISHGATAAFDKLQTSAQNVNAVYTAAGQILDVDYSNTGAVTAANDKLFAAGEQLRPLSNYALNGGHY